MRSPYIFALVLLLLLATACATAPAAPPTPQPTSPPAVKAEAIAFPISLTDDAGRQVTIPAEPKRIVSVSPSNTEIVYALGLEDRVVAVEKYSNYPPEAKEKPNIGSYSKPDLEKLVAAEPDLVLATGIHTKGALAEMEKLKLTVLVVDPRDVDDVMEKVQLVGRATGKAREAGELATEMRSNIDSLRAQVKDEKPVRVFFELSPELHTAGPGTFVNDMIALAGGANIASDAGKEWPQLNQEAVILANPEVILLGDHGSFGGESPDRVANRPGWQEVDAVKNSRVYPLDPDLTNRPGPRLVQGLETMVKALHPDKAQ